MTETEVEQFASTLQARLRNVCHHAAAALKQRAKWMMELMKDPASEL